MRLLLREFRSRQGEEQGLLNRLRESATRLVRDRQTDSVLVCQRADQREHVLWIEHPTERFTGSPTAAGFAPLVACDALDQASVPLTIEFADGFYRFPLPACRVWALDTHRPDVARVLLALSRVTPNERGIAGISVYRVADEPARTVAFLALDPDIAAEDYLRREDATLASPGDDAELACYPLTVAWTVGRLMPSATAFPVGRYPAAAFWARLGRVSTLTPSASLDVNTAPRT